MTAYDFAKATRAPSPPPFAVGTRLRYIGANHTWTTVDGIEVPLVEPGMVVTVARAYPGRRGTGQRMGYASEDGGTEYIVDRTTDGWCAYDVIYKGQKIAGQVIRVLSEWEVVQS